jgi:hypothetical protein
MNTRLHKPSNYQTQGFAKFRSKVVKETHRPGEVNKVTGLWFDPGQGNGFFSSLQSPDRLWEPPSLLSKGYLGLRKPGFIMDQYIWTSELLANL